ncbi:MAG: WG repeat-containing protein [Leptospiraceae bacterium]|nr:WG repeat-containing protein [Leptospiraceae bacterium]
MILKYYNSQRLVYLVFVMAFTMVFPISILATDCYYKLKDSESTQSYTKQTICGKILKDKFIPDKQLLARIHFDSYGLAGLLFNNKAYYTNLSGKTIEVLVVQNEPDKFIEGFVRFSQKDKYGYINENLDIAIPAIYDYAFSFEGTSALVCNQCKKELLDNKETVLGGFWGMVNAQGEEIIPVQYDRRKADKDRKEKEELDAQYKRIAEFELMLKQKEEQRRLKAEEEVTSNQKKEISPKKGFFETMYDWFSED